MARIKLIIADSDAAYATNLGDFILTEYAQVFEVATFSKAELLETYLKTQEGQGILLISPTMLQFDCSQADIVQILLAAEPVNPEPGSKQLFKYLSGPNLVQGLLKLYSECVETPAAISACPKKTKVIAVYSPAGGTGKTTVALGCSLQTAWEGNSVFYLNLENMPSTRLFFSGQSGEGLSAALFYLRQKKTNANLKIEALKLTDPLSKVHYFAPVDSALDLWEDSGDSQANLIRVLRSSGLYDYVFVDLSSQINTNNLTVLESSDIVLLVSTPEPACRIKDAFFLTELQRWSSRRGINLLERISPVWNKWESNFQENGETFWEGQRPYLKLPRVKDLLLPQGEGYCLDLNSPFGAALFQVRASIKD